MGSPEGEPQGEPEEITPGDRIFRKYFDGMPLQFAVDLAQLEGPLGVYWTRAIMYVFGITEEDAISREIDSMDQESHGQ